MADQLRIIQLDSGAIQVWVWSDGPLHRGWYFREYPKRADVCVTVFRWLNGVVSIKGWEQRDPPDLTKQERRYRDFKPDWVNYRQGVADGRAEALAEISDLLKQAGQVIAWQCFGDCRAFGPEPIPTPSELISKIKRCLEPPTKKEP